MANAKDGLILRQIPALDIEVVFITGRKSDAVVRRAEELGATVMHGIDDKETELYNLLVDRGLSSEQCAYIGDDLNDYSAMKECGFKACPANGAAEIREICSYVSRFHGGDGAVRDICEIILKRDGKYSRFLAMYGA